MKIGAVSTVRVLILSFAQIVTDAMGNPGTQLIQPISIPLSWIGKPPRLPSIPLVFSAPLLSETCKPVAYLNGRKGEKIPLECIQLTPSRMFGKTWFQFAGILGPTDSFLGDLDLIVYGNSGCSVSLLAPNGSINRQNRQCVITPDAIYFSSDAASKLGHVVRIEPPQYAFGDSSAEISTWSLPTVLRWSNVLRLQRIYVAFPRATGMLGYLDLWHWPALRFLRWELRIFNRKAAKHPKGLWDLGDHSSLLLRFLSLRIKFEKPAEEIYYTTSEDNQYSTVGGVEAYIHQESSGGCAWRHANHVNRIGRISVRFAGGIVQDQEGTLYAPRLEPLVVAKFGDEYLLLALHPFWQAFPRAIRISREQIVLEGLSSCSSGTAQFHELQGGECFRLQGIVLWSKNIIPDRSALEWYLAPFHAVPTWQYLADCGSLREVGIFGSPESEEWRNFLSGRDLVEELQSKVMQQDEFGWRNFGEIPADHERIYYRGHAPFVSHYNNQYDLLAGLIYMLLYRQDVRLLEYIHALARHVADIDIYHTREDRAAYNHGMFWHTAHYETAGLATHRTFSRIQTSGAGETGGGPSCEHLYSSGLYWYYLLSGEPWARDAVMELADFVIARDDGTKTIYRYFDRGPTGLASRTREEDYHGPGRGPGNAIDTLLNAWLLSGACKYVQKIRELIHRCFHPDNDVAALNLLDAENRWSYTVFLEAVIRFIEVSLSSDSYDDTVVYAASALLRYAKWMAVHERPYLEHAESLEYPTETWPCQDLRKSVILRWAARWAETPWIERMLSKAEAISQSAWESFRKFETCFTTRPLTLILTVGLREACLRKYHQCRCSDTLRAAIAESRFPPPLQFSPIEKRVWNKFPQACRWALRMLRDFLRQAR